MQGSTIRKFIPPVTDIASAVVLTVVSVALALANSRAFLEIFEGYEAPETWIAIVTTVSATAPIAFRRVFPLGSLVVIAVGMLLMVLYGVVEITATTIAAFTALISAGIYGREVYRDWARGFFALTVGILYLAAFISRTGSDSPDIPDGLEVTQVLAELVVSAMFVGLGWFLGDRERGRRLVSAELEDRNGELVAALERVDAQSANEERLAIARDVHDIVGHTVSLFGVQAAAARRQIEHNPRAAEKMLKTMEDQSRESVGEIRGLIAVLRGPSESELPASVTPTPSLDHLDQLIDHVRSAGAQLAFSKTGDLQVGAGLGLSIYRVVQEALSNAIRHGSGGTEVVVVGSDKDVQIFVSNDMAIDRTGGLEADSSQGSGLAGMRERVSLHGGTFSAGRGRDNRFEVNAVFPFVVSLTAAEAPSLGGVGA